MRNRVVILISMVLGILQLACNQPAAPPQAQAGATNSQTPPAGPGDMVPPKLVKRVHAEFPQNLWDKAGTVSVTVLIKEDGTVGDAKVVNSPHPELNPYAIAAVKQWQFEPAKKAGKAVPLAVTVNVQFEKPGTGQAPATK